MTTSSLSPTAKFRAEDNNGNPLSGGKLYTYQSGTTTPLATYTDSTGGTPNVNPVLLNSRGEADVWLGSAAYTFLLKDSLGNIIWQVDGIQIAFANFGYANYTGSGNITIPNPLATAITVNITTSGKNVILPPANVANSIAVGIPITIQNTGSNSFGIVLQDGSTSIVGSVGSGQSTTIILTSSATANGTWITVTQPLANPPGMVTDYAGATAPAGWLLCYGQAVSRTTYSALFAAISTVWGTGDGSTTFNLPDLRGIVTAGKDDMGGSAANRITTTDGVTGTTLGSTGGHETHTMTSGELVAHGHTVNVTDGGHAHSLWSDNGSAGGSSIGPLLQASITGVCGNIANGAQSFVATAAGGHQVVSTATTGITATAANTGSGTPFPLLQPTAIVNKIIKT